MVFYLGPLGSLVALPGVQTRKTVGATLARFGGIHQSLNGTGTLDVLGHKRTYTLEWDYLLPSEAAYLDRLAFDMVPGPLRLLDPTRVNRLSQHAATSGTATADVSDFAATTGTRTWLPIADPPSAAPVFGAVAWTRSTTGAGQLRAPTVLAERVPILPVETVTISAYVRSPSAATTIRAGYLTFNAAGTAAATEGASVALAASAAWTRLVISYTQAGSMVAVTPLVAAPAGAAASTVQITAWQVVSGTGPLGWAPGGAAPVVHVLDTSLTHQAPGESGHTLTLVEA